MGRLGLSCGNRECVGHVYGLLECGWCSSGVGRGLETGSDRVGWRYVCVSCEPGLFV